MDEGKGRQPRIWPSATNAPIILPALICGRLSLDEQRRFFIKITMVVLLAGRGQDANRFGRPAALLWGE